MKRTILRLTVAILTFGFGLVVDRVLISRNYEAPVQQSVEVEPITPSMVLAIPVVTTPSPPQATPTPNQIFDFNPTKFNPSGVYSILGSKPKEFQDFEYVEIWVEEIEGNLSGGVYFQNHVSDTYDSQIAAFSVVTNRRFVFITSPREDGLVYWFDGEFLHRNPSSVTNNKKAVLRGTLTKSINGRKVAERVVSFWIDTEDHC